MGTLVNEQLDKRDIQETLLYQLDKRLLAALLFDNTTERNIRWATDNYASRGPGFFENDALTIPRIAKKDGNVIRPRILKDENEQLHRVKDKAEVFTPAWVCNCQNNQIDNAWFGREGVFNTEQGTSWITNTERIQFSDEPGKTWQDYVKDMRLEISCGEAPYLTTWYDVVNGKLIDIPERVGLLDRKLRVVNENVQNETDWLHWAEEALKSTYAYEWQGDSLFLARENVLYAVVESYEDRFKKELSTETMIAFAKIIAWNIFQMDGIKCVIPNSCHDEEIIDVSLFESKVINRQCPGCKKVNNRLHNGIYVKVMDWKKHKSIRFVDLLKGGI